MTDWIVGSILIGMFGGAVATIVCAVNFFFDLVENTLKEIK